MKLDNYLLLLDKSYQICTYSRFLLTHTYIYIHINFNKLIPITILNLMKINNYSN